MANMLTARKACGSISPPVEAGGAEAGVVARSELEAAASSAGAGEVDWAWAAVASAAKPQAAAKIVIEFMRILFGEQTIQRVPRSRTASLRPVTVARKVSRS